MGLNLAWPSELSAGIKWAWKLLRGSVTDFSVPLKPGRAVTEHF